MLVKYYPLQTNVLYAFINIIEKRYPVITILHKNPCNTLRKLTHRQKNKQPPLHSHIHKQLSDQGFYRQVLQLSLWVPVFMKNLKLLLGIFIIVKVTSIYLFSRLSKKKKHSVPPLVTGCHFPAFTIPTIPDDQRI